MRLLIVVFFCSLVFACGTKQAKPFRGPNGNDAYSIHCQEQFNVADCYRRANQLCPHGYTELLTKMANTLSFECKEPKE
jgi:hypothetical protein